MDLSQNLTGLLLLLMMMCTACEQTQEFNDAEEREKILELHNLQRTYHFEKMAAEFASLLSTDHISVNRGMISTPTVEENTTRFQAYFDAVEFEKWDDISPPIIRFSDDYSLAYTIVDKEVVVSFEDENGGTQSEQTKFSWVAIYKRYSDGWKIDCVASTNQASVVLTDNLDSVED